MDFEALLASLFQPTAGQDVDATMTLVAGRNRLTTFAVRHGTLRFVSPSEADATFTFDSAEAALAILTGREDPIEAFMASRFRSDGNLPLAFVLLGLFRPGADATPPP